MQATDANPLKVHAIDWPRATCKAQAKRLDKIMQEIGVAASRISPQASKPAPAHTRRKSRAKQDTRSNYG